MSLPVGVARRRSRPVLCPPEPRRLFASSTRPSLSLIRYCADAVVEAIKSGTARAADLRTQDLIRAGIANLVWSILARARIHRPVVPINNILLYRKTRQPTMSFRPSQRIDF